MPITTNPTPAEIAALERRIAEGVMEAEAWTGDGWIPLTEFYKVNVHPDVNPIIRIGGIEHRMSDWSPWNDPAAALAVLDRLVEIVHQSLGFIPRILIWRDPAANRNGVRLTKSLYAESPGDHYGPAVCELARQVMEL